MIGEVLLVLLDIRPCIPKLSISKLHIPTSEMAAHTLHNLVAHNFNHIAVSLSEVYWTASVFANNNQEYNQNLPAVSAKILSWCQRVLGVCHGHTAMLEWRFHTCKCTWFKFNCNYRLCENKASGEDRGLISAQLELKQSLHSGEWYKEWTQ